MEIDSFSNEAPRGYPQNNNIPQNHLNGHYVRRQNNQNSQGNGQNFSDRIGGFGTDFSPDPFISNNSNIWASSNANDEW